jgi:gas vesicle protein
VEDRSRVAVSMLVGAALGGIVGYLAFTDAGRRTRDTLRAQVEGLLDDATRLTGSLERIQGVAGNGWRSVREFVSALAEDEPPYDDPDHGRRVS